MAHVGISILIPTYNRQPVLLKTLESLAHTNLAGLDLEVIVIDSNGPPGLEAALVPHRQKLSLIYLRENLPGKNRALNKALRECRLREFVVFIDDDISVRPDWLQNLVAVSARWPAIGGFGARVKIGWPGGKGPAWVQADWVKVFGFAWHDLGETELVYPKDSTPMGPCFWVRQSALQIIPLFDETIGPRPHDRIMGGEVSFLMRAQEAGVKMVYSPQVEVEHRIAPKECELSALRRRAFRFGRGGVRLFGLHRRSYFEKSRLGWTFLMVVDAAWYAGGRTLGSWFHPVAHRRAELALRASTRIGQIYESLRLGWRRSAPT